MVYNSADKVKRSKKYKGLTNVFIVNALIHGNFEMLEWLENKGCILNESTFNFGAANNSIRGMTGLTENGCPWVENTFFLLVNVGI